MTMVERVRARRRRIDLAAAGNAVVGNQGILVEKIQKNGLKTYITVLITMTIVNAGRLRPIR
jgi:hypothetical protein